MPRSCVLCDSSDRQIFAFPIAPEKRKVWCSVLGIKTKFVHKDPGVCCLNFRPSDLPTIKVRDETNAKKTRLRLKSGAVPVGNRCNAGGSGLLERKPVSTLAQEKMGKQRNSPSADYFPIYHPGYGNGEEEISSDSSPMPIGQSLDVLTYGTSPDDDQRLILEYWEENNRRSSSRDAYVPIGYRASPDPRSHPEFARFPSDSCSAKFIPFLTQCLGNMEDNRQQMASTVNVVSMAIHLAFGDQIDSWLAWPYGCLVDTEGSQIVPEGIQDKKQAFHNHNAEFVQRTRRFTAMLPGMNELEPSAKRSITAAWKWLIFWTIHHAPFMADMGPEYTTLDHQSVNHRLRNWPWQEFIAGCPFLIFIYKFSNELLKIGLDQTERYILMAIIMFEPDQGLAPSLSASIVHRHYTDVLLHVIKQRCPDPGQLFVICRKLEHFFATLKTAYQQFREYYYITRDDCLLSSVEDKNNFIKIITTDYTAVN